MTFIKRKWVGRLKKGYKQISSHKVAEIGK